MRTGRVRSTQVKSDQDSRCNGMRVAAKKQMRMFGAQFRTDYPGILPRSDRAFSPERHFHAPSKSCHKPTMKHWNTNSISMLRMALCSREAKTNSCGMTMKHREHGMRPTGNPNE